jgi:hypothetical protein
LAPFFARLASKFDVIFFFLNQKRIKNAEFHADFKSVEKIQKNALKKSYKQNKFDEHE